MCVVDALQPSLIPHFDFTTMVMNDGMHGEGDGILGEEEYQMIYMITRVYEWADYHTLNALKRGYPWRPGEEPPDLHESVQKGAAGNVPTKGTRVRFSASQTLRWAKHSPVFLKPIIKDPTAPFWLSWLIIENKPSGVIEHCRDPVPHGAVVIWKMLVQPLWSKLVGLNSNSTIHSRGRLGRVVKRAFRFNSNGADFSKMELQPGCFIIE